MTRHYLWNEHAELMTKPLAAVLMDLRREDGDNDLLMDAVTLAELTEEADRMLAIDGVVAQYTQLERVAGQMEQVMRRASGTVKPVAKQISDPFTQYGALQVVVLFELSDGQTISVYFHNPDTTPKKIAATDELVSWKWLLNKKDVTILVAPEQGRELNAREVARRVMKAAEKNSAAFVRNNAKRAERLQAIEAMKTEIGALETECKDLERRIEEARARQEEQAVNPEPAPDVTGKPEIKDNPYWAAHAATDRAGMLAFIGYRTKTGRPNAKAKAMALMSWEDLDQDTRVKLLQFPTLKTDAPPVEPQPDWYSENPWDSQTPDETDITPEAIARVDAAYRFENATDEFKAWVAESVDKPDYSPFKTARAMEERAKTHGATIEWGMFGGAALDAVYVEDDDEGDVALDSNPNWDRQPRDRKTGRWVLKRMKRMKQAAKKAGASIANAARKAGDYVAQALKGGGRPDAGKSAAGKLAHGADEALEGGAKLDPGLATINEIVGGAKTVARAFDSAVDERDDDWEEFDERESEPDPYTLPLFDSASATMTLDGVDQDGYVGKIRKDGEIVGRVDFDDEGWAMVYVGADGTERVRDWTGKYAVRIIQDGADMVDWLFARLEGKMGLFPDERLKAMLLRGDLNAIERFLPLLNQNALKDALLRNGFAIPVGGRPNKKDILKNAWYDINRAVQLKTDGFGLLEQDRQKKAENAALADGESGSEITKPFQSYLKESGGDTFTAAKRFFQEQLQRNVRFVPTKIGKVFLTGATWKEFKRGMKSDELKARLLPFVPEILQTGDVGPRTPPDKERSGDYVAFYFFSKDIDLGDVLVTAGVNVGERENGEYALVAYGLGHNQQASWQRRKAAGDPGYEPGPTTSTGDSAALDSTVDDQVDGFNIVILKVIDKVTGERLEDLEDDADGADGSLRPDGAENTVKTAKGTKIETGFTVVEADTLIVSHDSQGNPNPDYPAELQPRDRGRETSIAWVRKTANQLDPDSLGKTRRADTGAPIVGPDRVVESGNGRTMAIQEAYRAGKADEYRAWLIEEAESFGLKPARIMAMRAPILVRVRTSDIDRRTFAIEANQDDKLAMTATEKARSDADRLDEALLSKLADDGDLLSAANRDFIRGFLASLGDAEAAQYITTDGQPTAALIARVQAAVFAKAYSDDRLLELTADASKPEIANILNALNAAALEFIRAQAAAKGATDALTSEIAESVEVSLNAQAVQAIIDATNLIRKARAEGQSVDEVVNQRGLFDDIPPATAAMALFIHKNNRSAKRMAIAFRAMARHVRQEAKRGQTVDLFGDLKPATLEDIIGAANRELEREYGEGQFAIETLDLFAAQSAPEPQPAATEPEPTPEPEPVQPATEIMPELEPPATDDDRETTDQEAAINRDPSSTDTYINDIPRDAAQRAYQWSSMVPEQRAEEERLGYAQHMVAAYEQFRKAAEKGGTLDQLGGVFDEYREGYRDRLLAQLAAKSRTASSMVTGASNFPTRQNQKRLDTEHKRLTELVEWDEKARQRAIKTLIPELQPIKTGDSDAIQRLEDKVAKLEAVQEQMKAINKIVRSKQTDEEKVAAIMDLGFKEATARELLEPDFAGRTGFSYQLTNNSAEIRRAKERLEQARQFQAEATQADGLTQFGFDGGSVELNYADNRLRIFYDGKPSADARDALKKAGFKWSPLAGAWQRQLTEAAKYAAQTLTGVSFSQGASDANPADSQKEPEPTPEPIVESQPEPTLEPPADPQKDADRAFLQSVIDGGEDFYDAGVTDRLASIAESRVDDPEIAPLIQQAKTAAKNWFVAEFKRKTEGMAV